MSSEFIIHGPEPIYEPTKGGLGYEIFEALKRNKEKLATCIIETGEENTYAEILEKAIKTAQFLQTLNLQKPDFVSLCSSNNINSTVPFIASQFIGVGYFSLDPAMLEEDIIYVFEYLKPKVVFIESNVEDKIRKCMEASRQTIKVVVFGKTNCYVPFYNITKQNNENKFQPVFLNDLKQTALVLLSSGTTGKPKAICINHYSLLAQTLHIGIWPLHIGTFTFTDFSLKLTNDKDFAILDFLPLYWISSIVFSLNAIFKGSLRVTGAKFNTEVAWKAFEKYKIKVTILPPGQVNELCMEAPKSYTADYLEIFITGGGLVTDNHLKNMKKCFPRTKISQIYGMSEHAGQIATYNMGNRKDVEYFEKHLDSCGRPSFGVSIKVVDPETNQTCGPNVEGELRVKNKFVMNGYYKIDSTICFDENGWFKTGDLAKIDQNGFVYILDRLKDILLYSVYNIRPAVIEDILAKHPAVFESFVIGIPHPKDNEHPMGVVVLKKDFEGKVTADEIVNFVNERVSADKYKIRAGVKIVKEIIRTPTGKIKKIAMKKSILEGKM